MEEEMIADQTLTSLSVKIEREVVVNGADNNVVFSHSRVPQTNDMMLFCLTLILGLSLFTHPSIPSHPSNLVS